MLNLNPTLNSKFYLVSEFNEFSEEGKNNLSVYSKVEIIKSWNSEIDYFLDLKIARSFNSVNKNKLENVFKRYLKDNFLWGEIIKMLNHSFVSISNDLVYNSKDILGDSLLSSLLLNLYLKELDDFVQGLIIKYNSRKEFYKFTNSSNNLLLSYSSTLNYFSPIKLEKKSNDSSNLKNFVSAKYECVS